MTIKKNKYPYCNIKLENQITRKQPCPNCNMDIFIRSGKYVTGDEAITIDWMVNLNNYFDVSRFLTSKMSPL